MDNPVIEESEKINIQEIIKPYLRNWLWFVIIPIVSLIISYFYLKLATPVFSIQSSVLIKDAKKAASGGGDFGVLQDLSVLGGMGTNSIDNEIEIFKSKKIMQEVVKQLRLQTSVYTKYGLKEKELYKNTSPITIEVVHEKPFTKEPKKPILIKISGDNITLASDELPEIKAQFNKAISLPYATIIILKNSQFNKIEAGEMGDLYMTYATVDGTVDNIQKILNVTSQ